VQSFSAIFLKNRSLNYDLFFVYFKFFLFYIRKLIQFVATFPKVYIFGIVSFIFA